MDLKQIFNQHKGYVNRISRKDLCLQTGMGDSNLRMTIADLRLSGMIIVSSHTQNGYFLHDPETATFQDWQQYYKMISDLKAKLNTLRKIIDSQEVMEGQMNLFSEVK
jgi:hypothetical protein